MKTGSFIAGEWVHPKSDRKIQNLNPGDLSDVIAEFPAATGEDAQRAITAAGEAYRSWRKVPAPERGRVLWRAAEIAKAREEEIAQMLSREEGKILREARGEVKKGINVLEFFAGEGFRIEGRTLPSEARDTFAYTVRGPLGVVGLITPWNFPWAIPCWKIAPALVAGNAVVFKPAVLTPGTAALLCEILDQAGLPKGVLSMVVGPGGSVGEAMVDHPAVRAVSFTGSNEVGGSLYARAAKRGIKVTCEMGGKNAVLVLEDADIGKAATAIHGGAFGSTGQRCTATSRVIVHPAVKGALVDALVERASKMKIGPGLDPATDMGPAVDKSQYETDLKYVKIAKEEGARVIYEGKLPPGLPRGYYVAPVLFDEVNPKMRIFREEVFGPVLAVCTARDLDEAIHLGNSVDFGLTTSIFTNDVGRIMRFVDDVETGMVHVNEPTIGGEAQLPFGGSKATGVGEREMSKEGLNFFTEIKTVFINYSGSAERSMIR